MCKALVDGTDIVVENLFARLCFWEIGDMNNAHHQKQGECNYEN